MASQLAIKQCIPCKGGTPPLTQPRIDELLHELEQGWTIEQGYHLTRTYKFRDFVHALEFVNRVGAIAEQQQHHPDLHLGWGKVTVEVWTHKIKGLTESDFIFAAKCDQAFAQHASA
jgi:4a-hydroxytetrahydrobiopterin dehydratase